MEKVTVKKIYRAIREQQFDDALAMIQSSEKYLHSRGYLGGDDWLQFAAYHGYDELVEKLLAIGFDPKARSELVGKQALAFAASQGHLSTMRRLLDAGAELDVSESVRNPVITATTNGHIDAVKLLIDAGIDLFVAYGEDKSGTALVHALERGENEIANLIVNAMAKQSRRTVEELVDEAVPHKREMVMQRILPSQDDIGES